MKKISNVVLCNFAEHFKVIAYIVTYLMMNKKNSNVILCNFAEHFKVIAYIVTYLMMNKIYLNQVNNIIVSFDLNWLPRLVRKLPIYTIFSPSPDLNLANYTYL